MREISLQLRFITPCLGNVRRRDFDRFTRDSNGRVVFMQSWWRQLLDYGARAFGKHQHLMSQVRFHPCIEGVPNKYRRFYTAKDCKVHEAFLARQLIGIRVMLPDGIDEKDFRQIMNLAGQYRGISPYGWQDGYGQFEVIDEHK